MRRLITLSTLVLVVLALADSAAALPFQISLTDFSGSQTVVDFNSIANATQVTGQFAADGVTFSGALYGLTNSGDTNLFPANGGGVIASNWIYDGGGQQGLSFTAIFSSPVNRVGFYLENWPDQTATVEIFDGATSLGSIAFTTVSLAAEFKGLQNSLSFDRVVFTNTATFNGFYAIDDFQFETAAAVPEPGTIVLLGAGLIGLARRARARS